MHMMFVYSTDKREFIQVLMARTFAYKAITCTLNVIGQAINWSVLKMVKNQPRSMNKIYLNIKNKH